MSVSTSLLAYTDCVEVYDQALASNHGVRVRVKDHDAAWNFRMRMHQARKLIRIDNARTYEDDHPLFGKSPYDAYTLRIKQVGDKVYVYLEPNRVLAGAIEPLGEEDTISPPPEPELEPAGPRVARRI